MLQQESAIQRQLTRERLENCADALAARIQPDTRCAYQAREYRELGHFGLIKLAGLNVDVETFEFKAQNRIMEALSVTLEGAFQVRLIGPQISLKSPGEFINIADRGANFGFSDRNGRLAGGGN